MTLLQFWMIRTRSRAAKQDGYTSTMMNAAIVAAAIVAILVLVFFFGTTGDTGNVGG